LPKNGTCAVRRATIESHYPLRKYFLRVRSSLFRRAPTRSSSINRSTTSPLFHRYSSARSNLYRTYFSPFLLQNTLARTERLVDRPQCPKSALRDRRNDQLPSSYTRMKTVSLQEASHAARRVARAT